MDLDNNRKLIAAALAAVGSGDPNALQTVYRLTATKLFACLVLLWLIFTIVLFIGEPLAARAHRKHGSQPASKGRLSFMQWLHWVLLLLSAITVLAAVAGSQGMSLVP